MAHGMNWDKQNHRARAERQALQAKPVNLSEAFETLSFYLKEYDVDTRYLVSIPSKWQTMTPDELLPYFKAHKSGACKSLRSLKSATWCRISRETAESVGVGECELCCPYSKS
jgi:hypothetical protein